MQIGATTRTASKVRLQKSGNAIKPSRTAEPVSAYDHPFIDELAQALDPTNMSRNEARDMALALGQSGDLTTDNEIALHSMVLTNENGDTESDAMMDEKINMVEALNKQIEFNRSNGHAISHLEDGLKLLEKFKAKRENPKIDLYT